MNIGQYRKYCKENFEVSSWRGKIHDKRKRPETPDGECLDVLQFL